MKKLLFILLILLVTAVVWIVELRRRLDSAQMRGDTYRDIALRLDRRLATHNDIISSSAAGAEG